MTELLAVGNWKMNTTVSEAVELALAVRRRVEGAGVGGVRTVVCPPFVSLAPVKEVLSGSEIGLGHKTYISRPRVRSRGRCRRGC